MRHGFGLSALRKFVLVGVLAAVLSACGASGAGTDDFAEVATRELLEDHLIMLGASPAEAKDLSQIEIVSVDNIRSSDGATFTADIVLRVKKTGRKDSFPLSIRKIDGTWVMVETQR
ncbi:hypothetical protein [Zavarzinia compransoris]|uniref:DUF4878 domain-containing protein n=1 Tax=Zavarzinia compransoris TaxID=1264899 RepID=A0A317E2K4_9PROT|nr:hypothetical protein [Zavarzinia compransoris]PWR20644.1 hypothetical protein DKG75_11610 [Zavarzinia compransoris]TDP44538.1 hypothetical protein DES42_107306 [Zavarzinia compransoris]